MDGAAESSIVRDYRALMRIQIATLFTLDGDERLVCVNDPTDTPAPRFFLGRTAHGSEWRFRRDVSATAIAELHALCREEPEGDEILEPPYGLSKYKDVLARQAPVTSVEAGPAYRFPERLPETPDVVFITTDNRGLLLPYCAAWLEDVVFCQPFAALVKDGHAVSVCASVRTTPAAHEAGVETHGQFRRHGYAARTVAAWATAVRARGSIPLYSTSWPNTASQAVAARLGLLRYGTDLHIT